MSRYCKSCGNKIPRKIPHTNKKTSTTRKNCYNCSPPSRKQISQYGEERRRRKKLLVEMLGGQCVHCGYDRSMSALSFHHKDPSRKKFDISNNGNLLKEWRIVVKEAKKCELLCLNCHAEKHNGK
jgi:hypothetical protein